MKLGKAIALVGLSVAMTPVVSAAANLGQHPAAERALSQLQAHASEVRMSAHDSFSVRDVIVDADGSAHVRLLRSYRGLPVIGGDMVIHLDHAGSFRDASLTMPAALALDTTPLHSSKEAIAVAKREFNGTRSGGTTASLAIYARNGVTALVHDVLVRGETASGLPSEMHYIVDAQSLAVLDRYDDIKTTAATGTGYSLLSGTVSLTTDRTSSTSYALRDPSRGSHYVITLSNRTYGGSLLTDSDNVWGNSSTSSSQTIAVDALYGQNQTWDFYQSLGRNGIDGQGGAGYSRVHYSRNYVNAYWSDSCFCMTYGDGDGSTYLPLVALDVAGHEMTHGVTANSAGLVYSGESGGLNEAISDMMGTAVEFRGARGNNTPNFLIGERIYIANNGKTTPTTALRYMFLPHQDGSSPNCYTSNIGSLDVHYSSGVANHFFYLLSQGAVSPAGFSISPSALVCNGNTSLTPVGLDAASRIVYRALTVYMTSSTNYAQARTATLSAARDLYGSSSTQYAATAAAWSAVSVN